MKAERKRLENCDESISIYTALTGQHEKFHTKYSYCKKNNKYKNKPQPEDYQEGNKEKSDYGTISKQIT